MDTKLITIILISALIVFLFIRSLFNLMFSMGNYSIHRKRLKQLNVKVEDVEQQRIKLIETLTEPIIKYILPSYKMENLNEIAQQLYLTKWNKYFSPKQYVALDILGKIVGIILFFLNLDSTVLPAIIIGGMPFFGVKFLLKNFANNEKERLISGFPEFIRVVGGILPIMNFVDAVEASIEFVNDSWKPILRELVINCDTKNVDEALNVLKERVDVFEVREFVALIKLKLEQGGSIIESFESQAEKVAEMLDYVVELKIDRREMMATVIQVPVMLTVIIEFALPTVYSMATMILI